MTNLEKWMFYNKDVSSPESFIKWGWYYTVVAALQRRVWIMDRPIFPNLYVVLVGPAGVGKGLVIAPVNDLLKFWPYKPQQSNVAPNQEDPLSMSDEDVAVLNSMLSNNGSATNPRPREVPQLINTGSSATTYEALVRHMGVSTRAIKYLDAGKEKIYAHCSSCFCLEELGSLFRQHSEDVVRFLLETYDCRDYTYDTKHQGKDSIKKCCVSLLAGTTPSFMERCFTDELLSEGIASRTIFIYETRNRFARAFIETITPEQEQAKKDLLEHIKKLSQLYGKIQVDRETIDSIEAWWQQEAAGISRANKSPKLEHYYARKQLHLAKTAMALHFSESLDMKLSLQDFWNAQRELQMVEEKMHFAITLNNKNPLYSLQRDMLKYLKQYGPTQEQELIFHFIGASATGAAGLKEALDMLVKMKRIECKTVGNYRRWVAVEGTGD